jgi:hypothetical protein
MHSLSSLYDSLLTGTRSYVSFFCALQCGKTAGVTAQGGYTNKPNSGTAIRPPATNTKKPASTTTNTHKKPSSQPTNGSKTQGRTLREVEQCGGKGAECEEYGSCADKAFPGCACGAGLTCHRQNEWYWQVGL